MQTNRPRCIMMADMQSFYASIEKARHPEYKNKPLVVAGDPNRRSGIILAACPIAKSFGVETAEALWQAYAKCPDLVVIQPQMQYYINISMQITGIIGQFTDLIEPYSIDELFFDCSYNQNYFGNPLEIAKMVQTRIQLEVGVFARVGISENKVLAKLCTDLIAKKIDGGIYHLRKDELDKRIWHFPINKMWNCGSKMTQHFGRIGIYTIGDLANTPLPDLKRKLKARFGRNSDIQAEVLWRIANGHDDSPVTTSTHDHQKMIGNGMTLPRDYVEAWEIEVVLLDITSQVCRRLRSKNVMGSVVSVSCMGADFDNPTGFSRQMKIASPSNTTMDIYNTVKVLFHTHWDKLPVRRVGVAVSSLTSADTYQLDIFDVGDKKKKLDATLDSIKDRYGESSILRASSFTTAGQARDRAAKIGGHYK